MSKLAYKKHLVATESYDDIDKMRSLIATISSRSNLF